MFAYLYNGPKSERNVEIVIDNERDKRKEYKSATVTMTIKRIIKIIMK